MVQMGWEYPVPPVPTNALMGLMGDAGLGAGGHLPQGVPPAAQMEGIAVQQHAAHQAGAEAAQQHLGLAAAAAALIGKQHACMGA